MTGPKIDPLADIYQDPLADVYGKKGAPASTGEPSFFEKFLNGMRDVRNKNLDKNSGVLSQLSEAIIPRVAPTNNDPSISRSLGSFAGDMAATAPLYAGVGGAVTGLGEGIASKLGMTGVKKALLTGTTEELPQAARKLSQFARAVGVALPSEAVTNVVATGLNRPEDLDTTHKFLVNASLGTLGAAFKGFSAIKGFHAQVEAAPTVAALREVKAEIDRFPQHDPPLQLTPPGNPQGTYVNDGELPSAFQAADKKARRALDAAVQQKYDDLMSGKYLKTSVPPSPPVKHLDTIEKAYAQGLAEQLKARIQIVPQVGKGTRSIEGIGIIGSSNIDKLGADELQGYYDMVSSFKPYKDARLGKQKLRLDEAAKKGFSYLDPREIFDAQQDLLGIAHKLSKGFDAIGPEKSFADVIPTKKSLINVDGSDILSNVPKLDVGPSTRTVREPLIVPQSVYKGKTNFDNDLTVGKIENVGSGPQSAQAYVPPEIPMDPLAQVLGTKTRNIPPQTLSEAEADIAKHIDFKNANAQEERLNRNYLLTRSTSKIPSVDKIKRDFQDFLLPIQKVSSEAYDAAQKLLRVSVRQREAIANKLSIPDGNGGYTEGPMSLPSVYKMAGEGNRDKFDIYAHSMQVIAGEAKNTPFSVESAKKVVENYQQLYPTVVQAYDQVWKPLTKGIIDLKAGYKNSPGSIPSALEAMREKEAYASTARAVYQDRRSHSVNANKARDVNATPSTKQIADLASSTAHDIQNTVKIGEQSRLVNEFYKAKMADPTISDDIIKILPYEPPPSLEEVIAGMDPDLPYQIKHALAEGFLVHPVTSNKYNIRTDAGSPVTVQLGAELPETMNMLDGWSNNSSKKLNIPGAQLQSKVEKKISTVFSVVRDLSFGVPSDWFEFMMNQSHGYKPMEDPVKFIKDLGKDLASPIKGFVAQHNQTDIVHKLQAHGAGASFHGDTPQGMTQTIDEILARNTGSRTTVRPSSWQNTFTNLASDLANAVRTGAALRDLENGATLDKAATTFNNVLGDPYIVGAKMAAISRHIAFMNYPIQANARILSNFTDPKKAAQTVLKGSALLTAPTVALWFAQKDDEELRMLRNDPDGRRYTYFRNPFDEKDVMKVPKLYLYGALFQTPIETALDALHSKAANGDLSAKDAIEKVGKAALEQITPNIMPLTANAVLPMYTGQTVDPFQGSRQLIPASRKNLLPEDQGDASTSTWAKGIASVSGMPAPVVENIFKTFLIGPSYTAYSLADDYFAGGAKPPTFNKFSKLPGVQHVDANKAGIKYVNDFYDAVAKTQPILASLKEAQSHGQPERFNEIRMQHYAVLPQAQMIASFKRDMDNISLMVSKVKENEAWSPEDKQEEVGRLVKIRIQVAKRAMEKYHDIGVRK